MNKIELTYFDFDGGRAEPTRIAMYIAGVEFEDHRISFAQFAEMRESTPLNAVPVILINDVVHTQCDAMNRYYGKQADLYPDDAWQAFICDEVMGVIEDSMNALGKTFGLQGEELKVARENFAKDGLTRALTLLATRLNAAGGKYFASNKLTVADLKVFSWIRSLKSGVMDHIPLDLCDRVAPVLIEHMKTIEAEPDVKSYYASR